MAWHKCITMNNSGGGVLETATVVDATRYSLPYVGKNGFFLHVYTSNGLYHHTFYYNAIENLLYYDFTSTSTNLVSVSDGKVYINISTTLESTSGWTGKGTTFTV